MHPLTIILLGTTGNGKSATGNSLLGRQVFKEKSGGKHVTNNTQVGTVTADEYEVTIIDTPGFFDTEGISHKLRNGHNPDDTEYDSLKSESRKRKTALREYKNNLFSADERAHPGSGRAKVEVEQAEIDRLENALKKKRENWRAEQVNKSIMAASETGIHAFVLVINAEKRFEQNEKDLLNFVDKEYGGKGVFDYMFLLFTHADYIHSASDYCSTQRSVDLEEKALQHYLGNEITESLETFVDDIGGRALQIDNKEAREYGLNYYQVFHIYDTINTHIQQKFRGKPYTTEKLNACQTNLRNEVIHMNPHLKLPQKKLEKIRKEHKVEKQREIQMREHLGIEENIVAKHRSHLEGKIGRLSPPGLTAGTLPPGSRNDVRYQAEPRQTLSLDRRTATEEMKAFRDLQERNRQREAEIANLEYLNDLAEQRINALTKDLRNSLIKDAKWSLRSKEFKGFIKGLFSFQGPVTQQKAAAQKQAEKLEVMAKKEAEYILKMENPEWFSAYMWKREERHRNIVQGKAMELRDKGLKPIGKGFQKMKRTMGIGGYAMSYEKFNDPADNIVARRGRFRTDEFAFGNRQRFSNPPLDPAPTPILEEENIYDDVKDIQAKIKRHTLAEIKQEGSFDDFESFDEVEEETDPLENFYETVNPADFYDEHL